MDKDGGASTKLATYHGNGGGSMNGGLAVLNETTAFFGADQGTFPPCDAGIVEITLSSSSASEPFPFNCNTGPFPRRLALVGSSLLALSDEHALPQDRLSRLCPGHVRRHHPQPDRRHHRNPRRIHHLHRHRRWDLRAPGPQVQLAHKGRLHPCLCPCSLHRRLCRLCPRPAIPRH